MGEGNIFTLCVSPHLDLGGGGMHSGQVWMVAGYSSQVWMVGGYPSQAWMVGGHPGYPQPGLDGGGVPPTTKTGWGTPPPIKQSSIASTCYAASGMPLAFTQEDFLVILYSCLINY